MGILPASFSPLFKITLALTLADPLHYSEGEARVTVFASKSTATTINFQAGDVGMNISHKPI